MIIPDEDRVFSQLQAARDRQNQYLARSNPHTAATVAANASAYPFLKPGVALSLGQGGYTPDTPVAQTAAKAQAVQKVRRSGFGWHSVGDLVKPVVRGGLTVLASPYEESQGLIRVIAGSAGGAAAGLVGGGAIGAAVGAPFGGVGAVPGAAVGAIAGGVAGAVTGQLANPRIQGHSSGGSQSELGIAAGQLLRGKPVDLGSGFLPGGEVRKEQTRRAQQVSIGGHALTPGRLAASAITEPGTREWKVLSGLVDFYGAKNADPANLVLGDVAKGLKARKLFSPEDAGLIAGLRRTVATDRVGQWLDNPRTGGKVIEGLAGDNDAYSIWRRTGKKLDAADVLALSKLDDPVAVRAYLEPKLGVEVGAKPTLSRYPSTNPTVRRITDARLLQGLPGRYIDFDNPGQAVQTVDNMLRNAGIRDPQILSKHFTQMAEALASTAPGGQRYQAVTAVADSVNDAMKANGATAKVARDATTLFRNRFEALRQYNIDAIGNNESFPGVKINGAGEPAASPHLLVEALASKVPVPNTQEIRRATSMFTPLYDAPILGAGIKGTELALSTLVNTLWKPLVLIRGAWTARVVGEEQVRMAASGFDSFANHPLSALATVAADDGRLQKLLDRFGVEGRARVDLKGDLFAEQARLAASPTELEQALYKGRVVDPADRARRMGVRGRIQYDKEEAGYNAARAGELLTIRSDPIGQRVANGGLFAGDRTPNPLSGIDGVKDWFWQGAGRKLREDLVAQAFDPGTAPTTRRLSDGYIDTVVQRMATKTGGHPELIDAMRTGQLRGVPMRAGDRTNPEFVKLLEDFRDTGPQKVQGDISLSMRDGRLRDMYDSVINHAFEALMVKPSNYLSRSSTFRQAYWQRVRELVPFMDSTTRTAAIAAAEDANLTRADLAAFRSMGTSTTPRITSLDQADTVAKGYALHTTRDLLYDIAEKGQLSDQLRLVMPFAEAWKEVLTRWAKITTENPRVIRRGQQIVEGARGAGWFHPDPTTGQEVFNYPGSGFLSEHLLGVKVPFTGRVQGLSLAASIVPGVGPVVQYPASRLLPNTPQWDGIRQVLLPFGEPDTEGGLVESFLPAWMQKFRTATLRNNPDNNRRFANTVFDVARYLVSTGDYNTESPEEVDRLMTAATTKAKGVYALRGAAQFFAPSAPTPEMLVKDRDGHFQTAQLLIDDYRKMQQTDPDNATQQFLDKYGDNLSLLLQPKTQGGGQATSDLAQWARAHPTVVRRYKDVYSYFGPQTGDFDIGYYTQQIERGERTPLKPDEWVKRGNNRVAAMIYHQARTSVGDQPSDEQRIILAQLRDTLMTGYPGYNPEGVNVNEIAPRITQLQDAVKSPTLAKTDAGQGIALYLQAREAAVAYSRNVLGLSGGFAQANAAQPVREMLRQVASVITQAHPDFGTVFDQLLSREMKDDQPQPQVV